MSLLDWVAAAKHVELPTGIFRNTVKMGVGPAYVKPTRKKVMFYTEDLDRWKAGWERRPAHSPQHPVPVREEKLAL